MGTHNLGEKTMAERTAFLLAAYPAAGKTSLLHKCMKDGTPLFGEHFDKRFRSAIRVSEFDEQMSTQEKASRGMWFTLRDIPELNRLQLLPDNLVVHLDLLLLLIKLIRPDVPEEMTAARIEQSFQKFLNLKFFKSYSTMVANTLIPDFAFIASNWAARNHRGSLTESYSLAMKNRIILEIDDPDQFYNSVCRLWQSVIGSRTEFTFVSSWDTPASAPDSGRGCRSPD